MLKAKFSDSMKIGVAKIHGQTAENIGEYQWISANSDVPTKTWSLGRYGVITGAPERPAVWLDSRSGAVGAAAVLWLAACAAVATGLSVVLGKTRGSVSLTTATSCTGVDAETRNYEINDCCWCICVSFMSFFFQCVQRLTNVKDILWKNWMIHF